MLVPKWQNDERQHSQSFQCFTSGLLSKPFLSVKQLFVSPELESLSRKVSDLLLTFQIQKLMITFVDKILFPHFFPPIHIEKKIIIIHTQYFHNTQALH